MSGEGGATHGGRQVGASLVSEEVPSGEGVRGGKHWTWWVHFNLEAKQESRLWGKGNKFHLLRVVSGGSSKTEWGAGSRGSPSLLPSLKTGWGPGSRLWQPLHSARPPPSPPPCLLSFVRAARTQAAREGTGHKWIFVFAVSRVITQSLLKQSFATVPNLYSGPNLSGACGGVSGIYATGFGGGGARRLGQEAGWPSGCWVLLGAGRVRCHRLVATPLTFSRVSIRCLRSRFSVRSLYAGRGESTSEPAACFCTHRRLSLQG